MSLGVILPVVGIAFFLAGMTTLLILFLRILRFAKLSERERSYDRSMWQSDLRRGVAVVVSVVAIVFGNLFFAFHSELRLFTPVRPDAPLGMVAIVPVDRSNTELVWSMWDDEGRELSEAVRVHGQRFRLCAEHIHWSRPLAAMGLDDLFKVTQVEFLPSLDKPDPLKGTVITDVHGGSTSLFAWLRGLQSWIPLATADSVTTLPADIRDNFAARLHADSTGFVLR